MRVRNGRLSILVLIGALTLLCQAATESSSAQEVDWQTPFVIQNVDIVDASAVTVEFIEMSTGAVAKTLAVGPLAKGKSVPVRAYAITDLPPGKYSVVISSDAVVAAIVNQVGGTYAGSYVGGSSASLSGTSINFPNIVRNYAGWNSPFYVQNAGTTATEVTVRFYRFSDGGEATAIIKSLQAGQSWEINPATTGGLMDGTQYAVVATSTGQPLVGVANQFGGGTEMTYGGFASGSLTVYLPNITREYHGWNTPFVVQNVGTGDTLVTARYYDFATGSEAKVDGPHRLAAGKSLPFRPHGTVGLVDGTQYSVVVTSSAPADGSAQPIVAIVNQVQGDAAAMSYTGFGSGGLKSHLPNITREYAGWNTPFVVQNVGTSDTLVTARYYDFATGSEAKVDGPHRLAAGKSLPFRPHGTVGLVDGTQYSVVVTSSAPADGSAQPIVAIVNQVRSGYDAMAYEGLITN